MSAPGFRLQPKHPVGFSGNKPGNKQRKRGQDHHDERNFPIDRKHKRQRTQYGYNSGEKLGKAHQQSVCKLIDICNDTADDFAAGVSIQIAQRQNLNFSERLVAHIADHVKGDAVVDGIHQPLQQRCDADHNTDPQQDRCDHAKVNLADGNDSVNGVPDEDGHIKRSRNGCACQKDGERQKDAITADIMQYFAQRCVRRFFLCGVCHLSSPPF